MAKEFVETKTSLDKVKSEFQSRLKASQTKVETETKEIIETSVQIKRETIIRDLAEMQKLKKSDAQIQ